MRTGQTGNNFHEAMSQLQRDVAEMKAVISPPAVKGKLWNRKTLNPNVGLAAFIASLSYQSDVTVQTDAAETRKQL